MMRVVVIDDSLLMQQCVANMLAATGGAEVVGFAETTADAIALIDARQPDLVILDVALRDGDRGIDVLRHVARSHGGTRVLALSNFGWGAMRSAFLAAGAAAYFDKAFEFGAARAWVAELTDQVNRARKPQQASPVRPAKAAPAPKVNADPKACQSAPAVTLAASIAAPDSRLNSP
jgi:DNA-binding NarL/FixJ family response regulator